MSKMKHTEESKEYAELLRRLTLKLGNDDADLQQLIELSNIAAHDNQIQEQYHKSEKRLKLAQEDIARRDDLLGSISELLQQIRSLEVRLHDMQHVSAWRIGSKICGVVRALRASRLGSVFGWLKALAQFRLQHHKLVQEQISIARKSGMFDEDYYLNTYPLIKDSIRTPVEHYILYGEREGRQPNAIFRPYHYTQQLGEKAGQVGSALVHYAQYGHRLDIDPSPHFHNRLYRIKHSLQERVPLEHYLTALRNGSEDPQQSLMELGHSQVVQINRLQDEIDFLVEEVNSKSREEKLAGLAFTDHSEPVVSIVIPFFNHLDHTIDCLYSLARQPLRNIEVILVDDASEQSECAVLADIPGIKRLKNPENLGYLQSCNRGSHLARGKYLVQLNNDTLVLDGWLTGLLEAFSLHPRAGLVGSMMLGENGLIQEAGGIIFSDASGYNYGRGINPHENRFNYTREVDYCSGASIMIVKELWDRLGGYDPLYIPAYYEDTDLAMKVKVEGYRVLYSPASKLIHHEGVSSGKSTINGVKKYQVINQQKFLDKWRAELSRKPSKPDSEEIDFYLKNQQAQRWLLWVDSTTPTPDKDSGSIDTINFLSQALRDGWGVTFMPWDEVRHDGAYTNQLQSMGVECIVGPVTNPHRCISLIDHDYQVIVVSRLTIARHAFGQVRQKFPKAKIIFNTVDLHYLRYEREAALFAQFPTTNFQQRDIASEKKDELDLVRQSDATIVVSDSEKQTLLDHVPVANVITIPLFREIVGTQNDFTVRSNIGFIGGYQHPPNVDAVIYFVNTIFPEVLKLIPECKFIIAGADVPREIQQLASKHIEVRGYVEDLASFFDEVRLMVAPLRYGAGIKGKIVSGLCHGVPQVISDVANEGMSLQHKEEVMIAESPESFIRHICQVYQDPELWQSISSGAMEKARTTYSSSVIRVQISNLLNSLND